MSATKVNAWIRVGYKLLGNEGMGGMKIERLARTLKLNKSGFYYYFGSMNAFFNRLMEYHIGIAAAISEDIEGCDTIDPDLLHVVVEHKEFFLVEANLIAKSRTTLTGNLEGASNVINKAILSLWRKTSGVDVDPAAALAYVNIIRHFLYARIDQKHIDFEYLHNLTAETREVLRKVAHEQRVLR